MELETSTISASGGYEDFLIRNGDAAASTRRRTISASRKKLAGGRCGAKRVPLRAALTGSSHRKSAPTSRGRERRRQK